MRGMTITNYDSARVRAEEAKRDWLDADGKTGDGAGIQVTVNGPYTGNLKLPIGSFDDANGLPMTNEIYIDHKPDSYAFAGVGRKVLTRAQCVEKFPLLAIG